jgi:hypothetical protein
VAIKTGRSDKTEIKKFFLKISDHQQRWPEPLPGAILILPALLVVADFSMVSGLLAGLITPATMLEKSVLNAFISYNINIITK